MQNKGVDQLEIMIVFLESEKVHYGSSHWPLSEDSFSTTAGYDAAALSGILPAAKEQVNAKPGSRRFLFGRSPNYHDIPQSHQPITSNQANDHKALSHSYDKAALLCP